MKSFFRSTCIAVLLFASPVLLGQEKTQIKDVFSGVTGRLLLDELRLREAAAIANDSEKKIWSEGLTLSSFPSNRFSKEDKTSILDKLRSSSFTNQPSSVIFGELQRRAIEKGIMGNDDRKDLYALRLERDEILAGGGTDTQFHDSVLLNSAAVCCLVKSSKLSTTASGSLRLNTIPFSESKHDTLKLCPLERFVSQPTGVFCTGFLVAPNLVVTAGHCVDSSSVSSLRFVFEFKMLNATTAMTTFSPNDVYSGSTVVGRELNNTTGEDWAVIKLDRDVLNIQPLKIRRMGAINLNDDLYVVGYPSGLPCKFADGAKARKVSNTFVFSSNLDTYGGNSGSPVFNRVTHEVEGILVRGGTDFEFVTDTTGGCIRSVVLADSDGNEECTRTTRFSGLIP